MKIIGYRRAIGLLLLAVASLFTASTFGQGSLTPPGPPAPTMKTLAQIEPRTPISSAPFTITQPGSYYVTTNLTVSTGNAILITTNGVTLDLGGWTITSTSASANGNGIQLNPGLRDLTILNGHIRGGVVNSGGTYSGSGFQGGIVYNATVPANTRISGISVSGVQFSGIDLGNGDATVVESCTVRTAGSYGIAASTIKSSVAVECGGFGMIGDQVSDCRATSTGSTGLYASACAQNSYGATTGTLAAGLNTPLAQNCYGMSSSGAGLNISGSAQNCYGTSGTGTGLSTTGTALNCYGFSTSGTGIAAFIANGCHGATTSGTALSVTHNVNSF